MYACMHMPAYIRSMKYNTFLTDKQTHTHSHTHKHTYHTYNTHTGRVHAHRFILGTMKRSLRHLKWCLLMVPSMSAWVMPKTSAWLSSPLNVCINLHPAAMPLQLRTLRRRTGVQALEATARHDTEAQDSSDLQPHAPTNRWGKSMFVDAFKQSLKLQSQFASVCAAHCLGSYVAAKAASSSLLNSLVCVCKCCSSVSGDFSHLASHRTIKTRENRNFKDLSRLVVTVSVMLTTWLIPFDVRDVFACVRVRACACVRGCVGWGGE